MVARMARAALGVAATAPLSGMVHSGFMYSRCGSRRSVYDAVARSSPPALDYDAVIYRLLAASAWLPDLRSVDQAVAVSIDVARQVRRCGMAGERDSPPDRRFELMLG